MKTNRDLYWKVFCEFCIHTLVCRGKFDTRQTMLFIAKEMIIRGEY